jgi:hypothetical protein
MKGDLGESFEKLKSSMVVKYNWCVIIIMPTYYLWNGNHYSSIEAAKLAIDRAMNTLKNSIVQNK